MTGEQPSMPSLDGARHSCGGVFHLVSEPTDIAIRGTTVRVPQDLFRCDSCGAERISLEQLDAARERAAEKLREAERILTPAEIRALREAFELSQAELEHALGLGPKTVVRWESGKVMPNQATSQLLLLIKRDPAALIFLADRRGVTLKLPGPPVVNEAKVRVQRRSGGWRAPRTRTRTQPASPEWSAPAGKSLRLMA
jgi:putative zinc finger/helix-turn-helix YgiT family protein